MPSLFRVAGILAIVVSGLVGTAELIATGPEGLGKFTPALPHHRLVVAYAVLLIVLGLVLLAFCLLFAACTRQRDTLRKPRWLYAGLAIQLLIGVLFPDLMPIVACEAGLLLSHRATTWFSWQAAFWLAVLVMLQAAGSFTVAPELTRVPASAAIVLTSLQSFTWQLFAFAAGYLAGRESEGRRRLALSNAELLATQQVLSDSARMNERVHIARELHDTIGHHLAALSLKLQLADKLATEATVVKPVQDAHLIARLLLSDVRATVSAMREEAAIDLPAAIQTICSAIDRPRIQLQLANAGPIRDASGAHVLLRCVQEGVTNAIRHSGASEIRIALQRAGEGIQLLLGDNGRGAPAFRPGNGLTGMRERIEAAGGRLAIASPGGAGFQLDIWLPIAQDLP